MSATGPSTLTPSPGSPQMKPRRELWAPVDDEYADVFVHLVSPNESSARNAAS